MPALTIQQKRWQAMAVLEEVLPQEVTTNTIAGDVELEKGDQGSDSTNHRQSS